MKENANSKSFFSWLTLNVGLCLFFWWGFLSIGDFSVFIIGMLTNLYFSCLSQHILFIGKKGNEIDG